MPVEIELKLVLPLKRSNRLLRMPLLKSLRISRPKTRQLYSIYFDTPDFFLRKNGIAFRLRRDGKRWIQTIKDQGRISAGLFQHRENEVLVESGKPDYTKISDPCLKEIFSNPVIIQQIKPVFLTQFARDIHLIQLEDGTKIEFCLDRGTILANQLNMPICELELELKSGKAVQLFLFALTLQKMFPFSLRLENDSKAARGYVLSSGYKKPPVKATRILLNSDMCVQMAFKSICWNCLEHLSSNEYGILNKRDIEYLDQMCIALGRQQFALNIFFEIFPKKRIKPILRELKWFIAQFNLARDWGVFVFMILPTINNYFSDHQGISMLMKTSKQLYLKHHNIVRKLIKSKRYLKFLLKIGVWLNTEVYFVKKKSQNTFSLANSSAKEFSVSLLNEQHQHLKKYQNIEKLNASELYTLQSFVNKQCVAVDFFVSLYPDCDINPYLRSLHDLQYILGITNNDTISTNRLNEFKLYQKEEEINEAIGIILGWGGYEEFQKGKAFDRAWISFHTICPFWTTSSKI